MKAHEENVLARRIIPPVEELRLLSSELCELRNDLRIETIAEGAALTASLFRAYWGVTPRISVIDSEPCGAEGYSIEISADKITIGAATAAGSRHAMQTLRQLAEPCRGTKLTEGYLLPAVRIKDAPALAYRGVHLCWFPETPAWEIEKQLRLAAYFKFNHVIVEPWGVLRHESFPEYCWDEYRVSPDDIRALVSLARELGVTLSPQVNLFGHASAARSVSGKHVLLDFHPEFAPLFEPDGWTWCLSNPATRRYLEDMVVETHEIFGTPPFFHIGCDEADNAGSCVECRRGDYSQLVVEHISHFHKLLAERGARTMMWHDMLLERDDERWRGYTAYGGSPCDPDRILDQIPKDIIICDWQYGYPEKGGKAPEWPTIQYFVDKGFDVIACPWLNSTGALALGERAVRSGLMGILQTAWHQSYHRNTKVIFANGACAAWGYDRPMREDASARAIFNWHLRQVIQDMNVESYLQTGTVGMQIDPFSAV